MTLLDKIKREFDIVNELDQWMGHSEINFEYFKSIFRKQTYWEKCKTIAKDSFINVIGAMFITGQIIGDVIVTPLRLFTYPIKKLINHFRKKKLMENRKYQLYKYLTKNPLLGAVGIVNKGLTLPVIAVGFVKKTICNPIDNLLIQKLLEGCRCNDKNNTNGRKTGRTY